MHTTRNEIKHFGNLTTKNDKIIGQKRNTMSYELIDIHINTKIYLELNPVQITIKMDKIISELARYKNLKYHFMVDGLSLSLATTNDTNNIFITCNGLNEAKTF